MYHPHDTDIWNVHWIFITYIHRTQESWNTKNTFDFLVQVRNFFITFQLKVLRHKERDTHSFYSGFSICSPPIRAAPATRPLRANESYPSSLDRKTQLFQIPHNPLRTLPVHDVIHIPRSWNFYFDICERHILPAGASTPVLKFAPN